MNPTNDRIEAARSLWNQAVLVLDALTARADRSSSRVMRLRGKALLRAHRRWTAFMSLQQPVRRAA